MDVPNNKPVTRWSMAIETPGQVVQSAKRFTGWYIAAAIAFIVLGIVGIIFLIFLGCLYWSGSGSQARSMGKLRN